MARRNLGRRLRSDDVRTGRRQADRNIRLGRLGRRRRPDHIGLRDGSGLAWMRGRHARLASQGNLPGRAIVPLAVNAVG
jgi:hypothetical protein